MTQQMISSRDLSGLLGEVKACRHCEQFLEPRPVVQMQGSARLLIIGQAPGQKVHDSGIPWNDPSGDRLRDWMQIDREAFYDDKRVAIMPMGFCFPGSGKSGDLPPRKECAPLWHQRLLEKLPNIQLTLLIGQYAQHYYLGDRKVALTERVKQWHTYPAHFFPLPHPSPRNQLWLKKNPWFASEVIPAFRKKLGTIEL